MVSNIAVLWDEEVDFNGDQPFKEDHVNTTYEYFSELVAGKDGKIFVGRFDWYKNGELEKAYSFDGEWSKVEDVEVDTVFDKYKFNDQTVSLKKEIERRHPVLNSFEVEELCKDKLLAHQKFQDYHPETREATTENATEMLEKYGKVVVKPLAAHAGEGVQVIDNISDFESAENQIVQQFIDSSTGIQSLGVEGVHDLRVVVVNDKPVLSYVRQPESGFIANVAQGGSMEFISIEDVPEEAMRIVEKVTETLSSQGSFVCGVDMIFDKDQKPWILELNSKPGMSYYRDEEIKKWKEPYIKAMANVLTQLD